MKKVLIAVFIAVLSVLFAGCTPYVVTTPLEKPVDTQSLCCIGAITDELPGDMEIEKKPTMEEIDRFKDILDSQLKKKNFFEYVTCDDPETRYEVTGSIIEFRRGSGAVRFLIGFGLGNARLVATLKLVDKTSDETVFSGNFRAEVGDWMTKGDQIFNVVAKNFAKAIEKQQKKALESNPETD